MLGQISLFDGSKPFKIDRPIRLIELFAGYGSQHYSLEYLGVKFKSYKICEWAVKSIQAYKDAHFGSDSTDYSKDLSKEQLIDYLANKGVSANYNEPMTYEQVKRLGEDKLRTIYNNIKATHNLVNIQQVKGSDLEIVDTDKYCYIMTYSFPCITADSLILTKDGYKPMANVEVGEYVLTKSNTWQKVDKKFDNGKHPTCYVQAMCFENIHCTLNHKFYVREKYRKGHNAIRMFKDPVFKEIKDITRNDYFGMPIIQEEIPFYRDELDFWYMIGYYLGDGWLSKTRNEICLACNDIKLEKLKHNLKQSKWKWTCSFQTSCYRLRFTNKDIYSFIEKYIGTGCENKRICGQILTLPKTQLQALFNGYLDSDGCKIGNKMQFSTINRQMAYGISAIINKLYHRPVSFNKTKVKPQKIIQGRMINQKDWYLLRFNPNKNKQDKAFYEDGYIWYPFNKIEMGDEEYVYNMEIENDHSYIVQSCISKNCQDLSKAGKQQGMARNSGTRSGMLWEVERILDEIVAMGGYLPQVLLMENVPDVIGSKNIANFVEWRDKLESLGYKCYWKVLNAKDYGVPQNRERCFMVSILGDYYYDFPQPIKLDKRLKDLLEKDVDEKYYLSDRALQGAINTKFCCSKLENKLPKNGIVPTICARDYKDPKLVEITSGQSQGNRVYDPNGLSVSLCANGGGLGAKTGLYIEPKCKQIDIKTNVRVRKSEVNIKCLQECLKEHKKFSNKEIAEKLQQPLTLVEHWFRTDKGFVIPNESIWLQLKSLLDIETDEFDKSIMEFDIKPNEFDMSNRAYLENGLSPTITTNENVKIVQSNYTTNEEFKNFQKFGSYYTWEDNQGNINTQCNRACDENGISLTIATILGMTKVLENQNLKKKLCNNLIASGKVKENDVIRHSYSTSRMNNMYIQNNQFHDCSPTLDTRCDCLGVCVKDNNLNYIDRKLIETIDKNNGIIPEFADLYNARPINNGISGTLSTSCGNDCGCGSVAYISDYRIRKLTPKECFRLMGVKDEDFENIAKNQSNASLYHLAGDSIVVDVLMYIFKNMLD